MTNEEAIAIEHEIMRILVVTEEHKERVFTAHKMAIEALEKQIPKKPTHIDKNGKFDGNWIKACPVCGMKFVERFTTEDMSYPRIYHIAKYCECGQAIDWSDTE